MKILISRSELFKALQRARSVIEKRTTVPILSHVLVEAGDGNEVMLSSTDLELSINESIEAQNIEEKGSITVSAQMFYDIVSRLPEGSVLELSAIHQSMDDVNVPLHISWERSSFQLSTLPAEEYAEIKILSHPYVFTIKASDFASLIDKTKYAMCAEESRYHLNGIYMEILFKDEKPYLTAVATDGHRLAKAEISDIQLRTNLEEGQGAFPGILIPPKTIQELPKILDGKAGEIIVGFSSKNISFTAGGVHLQSRLIDGSFPDYKKVIPQGNPFSLRVSTSVLGDAVDRVSVMAFDKTHTIKLMVQGDMLTLSSSNPETGTAFEEIEVSYDGEPFETGFNARYLLEAARHIKGEFITISLNNPETAILLQDEKDPGLAFVIMPMRV